MVYNDDFYVFKAPAEVVEAPPAETAKSELERRPSWRLCINDNNKNKVFFTSSSSLFLTKNYPYPVKRHPESFKHNCY